MDEGNKYQLLIRLWQLLTFGSAIIPSDATSDPDTWIIDNVICCLESNVVNGTYRSFRH